MPSKKRKPEENECQHNNVRCSEYVTWEIDREKRTAKIIGRGWPMFSMEVKCWDCWKDVSNDYHNIYPKGLQEIVEENRS